MMGTLPRCLARIHFHGITSSVWEHRSSYILLGIEPHPRSVCKRSQPEMSAEQRPHRVWLSVVIIPAQPYVRRFELTERHVSHHERWRHPAGWTEKCSFIAPTR
jgi:hypothetical protein